MNVLQDIKAKFFNGDGYLLKLAIFIIGCALMLLLIFALPLYGIISGRIYDNFFRTPADDDKMGNKIFFIITTSFCVYVVYVGTIVLGECLCDIFYLKLQMKFIFASVLFLIYLSTAMYFNNSQIRMEIEKREEIETERARETE